MAQQLASPVSQQGFTCSTCRLRLASVEEQRAHFQTPLHAFNVRRKIVNMVPVFQAQFDERVVAAETEQRGAAAVEATTVRFLRLFSSRTSIAPLPLPVAPWLTTRVELPLKLAAGVARCRDGTVTHAHCAGRHAVLHRVPQVIRHRQRDGSAR